MLRRMRIAMLMVCLLLALPETGSGADAAQRELGEALHARPDRVHGEALYHGMCTGCHGPDGGGRPDGSVPAIAGQYFSVITWEIVNYRHNRRWDSRMERSTDRHQLGDAQNIADVALYVSTLPPTQTSNVGDGKYLRDGQDAYSGSCAPCHGADAAGSNVHVVPRLAGQHYAYLLRQLHDVVEGGRPHFQPEHLTLLREFDQAKFVGVADYLSRLTSRSAAVPASASAP